MKKIIFVMCVMLMALTASFAFAEEFFIPSDVSILDIEKSEIDNYFDRSEKILEYEGTMPGARSEYNYNVYCENELLTMGGNSRENKLAGKKLDIGFVGILSNFVHSMNGKALYCGLYDEQNNIYYNFKDFYIYNINNKGEFYIIVCDSYNFSSNGMWYNLSDYSGKFKPAGSITVTYNDEFISFDQNPVVESGRTLVPVRAIFEKLGADVTWDGATQTVTATNGEITINLTIDNTEATKNGEKITLDVPAKIINNRTLVPVRFVSDCFGVNVDWNGELQRVILTK